MTPDLGLQTGALRLGDVMWARLVFYLGVVGAGLFALMMAAGFMGATAQVLTQRGSFQMASFLGQWFVALGVVSLVSTGLIGIGAVAGLPFALLFVETTAAWRPLPAGSSVRSHASPFLSAGPVRLGS
jgi:hypothetical protein